MNKWSALKLNTKFSALIIFAFVIPIAFLAGMLYYNMEQNVIEENISNLSYLMDRNERQINTNMDAVNMSTQFTLSDQRFVEILNKAAEGGTYDAKELMDFYENNVAMLERLINNNPLIYGVRVYASNDNIQEMMPVLFKHSRMEKLSWAGQEDIYGWHFGYADTLFYTAETEANSYLLSRVTPVKDYSNGIIGTIEVVMDMSVMFPSLFEEEGNSWSAFLSDDQHYYTNPGREWADEKLLSKLKNSMENTMSSGRSKDTYYEKDGSERYVVSYLYIKELGGTLIVVRDISEAVRNVYKSRTIFIIVALAIVVLLAFAVDRIVKHMLRQFYEILKTLKKVEEGDLSVRIERVSGDEVGVLGARLNDMLDRIQVLMKDNINREVLIKNTEIRALQNQINAHFIYNSLESIKMMAEIDEEYEISDAITALGKLLRYSMRWVSGNVLVSEELEYIKNYVVLMNLRYDYEIILSMNLAPEILNQQIPKMSLQPIVENAIIHGIEEVAVDTTIYIKGYLRNDDCYIEISDSGRGMTEEQVELLKQKIAGEIEAGGGSGNGIGLKNVQDRINIAFGPEYGLDIASKLDCYTKIVVHLPHVVKQENRTV